MLQESELKQVDKGSGYFIGEIKSAHKDLPYLKSGCLVTLFDGVDVALDTITEKMPKPKRNKSSSRVSSFGSFNAFATYEEAMTTFRDKPESVVKFDPAELRIKDANESGTQVDYDVVGDYIDMGRYMEGIPESVGTMRNGNARNRRVSIILSLTHSGGVDHEAITHRSERILRLIDGLEAGGIRAQLIGIESSQCLHFEVVIKRHEEPLTVSDLAVATHPEFLRRPLFRATEYSKTFEGGYGSAVFFSRSMTPEVLDSGNNDELDIYIDGNMNSISTIDDLFDKAERLLVWEMSKPVPEVSSIKIEKYGIYFNPNGARSDDEIKREGQEVLNERA